MLAFIPIFCGSTKIVESVCLNQKRENGSSGPLEKHFNARLCATCFVSKNEYFGELKSAVSVPAVSTAPIVPIVPSCTYVCTDCTSIIYIYIYIYISVLIVFWFYLFLYTDCTSLYYNCTKDY